MTELGRADDHYRSFVLVLWNVDPIYSEQREAILIVLIFVI